jgi:hypothetical protein
VSFPLRPINTARDAADVMSDVMNAVSSGQLTPADAAEISKVVGCTVRAFEVAAMSERDITPDQLTDAELMRVITTGRYVFERLRRFLARRHKVQGRGNRRFTFDVNTSQKPPKFHVF